MDNINNKLKINKMNKIERIRCMSEERLLEELGNIAYVYENSINGGELAKYAMKEIVTLLEENYFHCALDNNYK